jgi:CRISPR type III-B/RAMP module RAMP protein Cmr1
MKRAVFKVRLLTPALISGAHPKKTAFSGPVAELREASIRGQLRWWHRFLGFDRESECRIYGVSAGDVGTASSVLIRILDAPEPVRRPVTSRDMGLDSGNQVSYLAFNLRNPEDARSTIEEGTEFHLLVQAQRISGDDWKRLIRVVETFAWLGALGTRSRRCFGALTLVAKDGAPSPKPASWKELLGDAVQARRVDLGKQYGAAEWRELFRSAGEWLRGKRKDPGIKQLFGMAGKNAREASSILLRPDVAGDSLTLLAIGRPEHMGQIFR